MSSLLLALAALVLVCQVMAALARRLGQPSVVGEIVGGLLLGPTLFGGRVTDTLFPADTRSLLGAFANVGVALFMFLVGLEFDPRVVRRSAGMMGRLCAGSLVVPFGLGALLAFRLLGDHPSREPVVFVVFLGTAMAVTAFPVLARIIVFGLVVPRTGLRGGGGGGRGRRGTRFPPPWANWWVSGWGGGGATAAGST
ncbi:cation:proton antiporter domain-containing protein, partial [Streptomyces sp. NPDC002536]